MIQYCLSYYLCYKSAENWMKKKIYSLSFISFNFKEISFFYQKNNTITCDKIYIYAIYGFA